MMKKEEKKVEMKTLKNNENPAVIQQSRMNNLGTEITKLINKESNKADPMSIFELTDVLLKVTHAFNKRFLNQDHQNMVNAKTNENNSRN